MKWIRDQIRSKIHILLPLVTLFCFLGFIGSLIFPDTVLDTYIVNMEEAEGDKEEALVLADGAHVGYAMDTKGLAMRGIQLGINKLGKPLTGVLCYDVYVVSGASEKTLVSANLYDVSQGDDMQYVYLPYVNYEQCVGQLYIDVYMQEPVPAEQAAAIMINHKEVAETETFYQDNVYEGSLKGNYIYTHKTYPFLYDFRVLSFIMLAVTMTVRFPARKKRKAGEVHAD